MFSDMQIHVHSSVRGGVKPGVQRVGVGVDSLGVTVIYVFFQI